MLDVSWVDEQLERVRCATATMQTARDYALLCIARDHLTQNHPKEQRSNSSSQFPTAPTLDDVEAALRSINVTTSEDRKRVNEAKEVTQILKGE